MNLKKLRIPSRLFCRAYVFTCAEWPGKRKKKHEKKVTLTHVLKNCNKSLSLFSNQTIDTIVLFTNKTIGRNRNGRNLTDMHALRTRAVLE